MSSDPPTDADGYFLLVSGRELRVVGVLTEPRVWFAVRTDGGNFVDSQGVFVTGVTHWAAPPRGAHPR